jgi:uncharacterized protein (UPF0216 family)
LLIKNPVFGLASFSLKSLAANIGTANNVIKKELARLTAIVSERDLKNAPVIPEIKTKGRKIIVVERDEPKRGLKKLLEAKLTLSGID